MIEEFTRPLTQVERRALADEVAVWRSRCRPAPRILAGAVLVMLLVGIPAVLWQWGRNRHLGVLAAGVVLVYVLIVWNVYREQTRDAARRIREHEEALQRDQADVLRCRSQRVVAIDEHEDFPALFLFQADEERLVYGELYRDELEEQPFPNTDFEVAKIHALDGKLLWMRVSCHGNRLEPERVVPPAEADRLLKRMRLPRRNFALMRGRLDQLEEARPL